MLFKWLILKVMFNDARILDLSQVTVASGTRMFDFSQVTCGSDARILTLSPVEGALGVEAALQWVASSPSYRARAGGHGFREMMLCRLHQMIEVQADIMIFVLITLS